MSVALLLTDNVDAKSRIVPVATEAVFVAKWLPGIAALGLEWGELMQTGFVVTFDNRRQVMDELGRLRAWMIASYGADAYELTRLDALLESLAAIDFDAGATAFLG